MAVHDKSDLKISRDSEAQISSLRMNYRFDGGFHHGFHLRQSFVKLAVNHLVAIEKQSEDFSGPISFAGQCPG